MRKDGEAGVNEQIEKLEHGLMICEATGTKLVHIEKADAEKILVLLKDQEAVEPITEYHLFLCPVCKNTLFKEQKFCHECGKRIEWEGR